MASRLVSGILSHLVMFSNLLIVALSLISFELGSIVKSNFLLRLSAWDTDASQKGRSQLHVGTFTIVQWNSPAPLKLLIGTFYNHTCTAKAIIKVTLYGCTHSICEWLHKPWFKWNAESPKIRGETVKPPRSFPIYGTISSSGTFSHNLVDLKIVES